MWTILFSLCFYFIIIATVGFIQIILNKHNLKLMRFIMKKRNGFFGVRFYVFLFFCCMFVCIHSSECSWLAIEQAFCVLYILNWLWFSRVDALYRFFFFSCLLKSFFLFSYRKYVSSRWSYYKPKWKLLEKIALFWFKCRDPLNTFYFVLIPLMLISATEM